MDKVIFKKASYDYDVLKPIVFNMMESIGKDLITKQARVLIKPNLLSPARPDKAVLTHPHVVKAVAEYVLSKGARPQISDSPATGSFKRIIREGGFEKAFKGIDVDFKTFKKSVKVDSGEPFGSIEIARSAVETDILINLAKLKTHSQMLLTLGVKNMFGCIIGFQKPEWHLRTGVDREMFARLLVQIYNAVKPSITIVDGILAMEGQGPGKSGTPRYLGLLIGGRNAFAVDRLICSLLGIDPDRLLTNKVAKELGLCSNEIYANGDFNIVDNFRFPELGSLLYGPKPFQRIMRKHIIQKPVVDNFLCELCGECWQYCPAKAITDNRKTIDFDYDKCIRCYCCIEICPHGALHAKETLPGRLLRRFQYKI